MSTLLSPDLSELVDIDIRPRCECSRKDGACQNEADVALRNRCCRLTAFVCNSCTAMLRRLINEGNAHCTGCGARPASFDDAVEVIPL